MAFDFIGIYSIIIIIIREWWNCRVAICVGYIGGLIQLDCYSDGVGVEKNSRGPDVVQSLEKTLWVWYRID